MVPNSSGSALPDPAETPASSMACICCHAVASFGLPRHGYATCRSCGLKRNEPFPSLEEINRHYAERSSGGNYNLETMAAFDRFRKEVYRHAFERIVPYIPGGVRGRNILDVGCFSGLSLQVIQEHGATAFGVELQEDAARLASARSPGRVASCDICQALPFEEKFSAVTLTDVIEHLHDPLLALRSLAASMEPGGVMLLTTPNTHSLVARLLGSLWPSYCPIHHLYLFHPASIAALLKPAGVELISCRSLWKTYCLGYVVWLMPTLSPTLGRILRFVPGFLRGIILPFNGGEMIVLARRRS